MKILAIEKESNSVNWSNQKEVLHKEALHVLELSQKEIIREIYFTENKSAILILECENKKEAQKVLSQFPLVQQNLIDFDIIELHAYTGINRLINPDI